MKKEITTSELIKKIANELNIKETDVKRVFEKYSEIVINNVLEGRDVILPRIGFFKQEKR